MLKKAAMQSKFAQEAPEKVKGAERISDFQKILHDGLGQSLTFNQNNSPAQSRISLQGNFIKYRHQ